MTALFSGPYALVARIGLYGLLVLALIAFGWFKGDQHGTAKLTDYVQLQAKEATRIAGKRAAVTERVVTEYIIKTVPQTQETIKYIDREVTKYVDRKVDICPVSVAGVELHDSAAANRIPDATRSADDTASGVTTAETIQACATNYAISHGIADRLRALQAWVREQAAVR